jgi:hypothetical protein
MNKLGKNPFEKEGKSRVGRMIEASFTTPNEPLKRVEVRNLFARIQQMNISLDVKEIFSKDFLKNIKDRLK